MPSLHYSSSTEKLAEKKNGCFFFNLLTYYEKLKYEFLLLNFDICLLLIFEK